MGGTEKYYQSIDLLRGITALLVAVFHFINHDEGSGTLYPEDSLIRMSSSFLPGVVFVFFLLSGFVILMTMQKHNYQLKKIGYFLTRRWIRIEIPYIASILIYLSIAYIWSIKGGQEFTINIFQLLHHLLYTTEIFDYSWYNAVYWTLALEFQFYLIIALLFPLFTSKNSIVKYTAISIFCLFGLVLIDNGLIFRYAPIFTLGMLMFSWLESKKTNSIDLIFIGLALIQIVYTFDTVIALYLLASLFIIQLPISESNILTQFGKQAYSFYLLHGAFGGSLLYFLVPKVEGQMTKILIVLIALVISIILSYVFFKLIETPSHKFSRRITYSKRT
jgi:peptidoglycan/LPS O-acetylase OafA/YrhL